jgi:hypothetical protein
LTILQTKGGMKDLFEFLASAATVAIPSG